MSFFMEKMGKETGVIITVLFLVVVGALFVGPVEAEAKSWKHELAEQENLKYSEEIVEGVFKQLRKERKGPLSFSGALEAINAMSKVEVMDRYLDRNRKKKKPEDIRAIVHGVYGIDLESVSELGAGKQTDTYDDVVLQKVRERLGGVSDEEIMKLTKIEVMEFYWKAFDGKMDGTDMRIMVNAIFGINLDGISSLEGSGVALFSKNQWISKYEKDLFVVHTGIDDVDVWVYPTDYFKQQTGLEKNPRALELALTGLGFSYNEEVNTYYYANPAGVSVPDNFKGQTLGTIIGIVNEDYQELK